MVEGDSASSTTASDGVAMTDGLESAWPETVQVMPFGDSITEAPQYRGALVDLLADNGCDFDMVGTRNRFGETVGDADHEGYARWSAAELAEIAQDRAAKVEPDVVIVHAGTNDLAGGTSPEVTLERLATIVSELQSGSPGTVVIVAQIIPYESDTGEVARFNELVAAFVSEANTDEVNAGEDSAGQVVLVDVNTGFDLARHARDGIHPNDEGGRRLATTFYDALIALNGPCQR